MNGSRAVEESCLPTDLLFAPQLSRGPENVWSAGIGEDFGFGERAKLRWEMTANNALNHPNWKNPTTDITNTTGLGVITSDGGVTNGSVDGAGITGLF